MYSFKKAFVIALFTSICVYICASIYSMNQDKKISEIYKKQDKKKPQTFKPGILKRSKATRDVHSLMEKDRKKKNSKNG